MNPEAFNFFKAIYQEADRLGFGDLTSDGTLGFVSLDLERGDNCFGLNS